MVSYKESYELREPSYEFAFFVTRISLLLLLLKWDVIGVNLLLRIFYSIQSFFIIFFCRSRRTITTSSSRSRSKLDAVCHYFCTIFLHSRRIIPTPCLYPTFNQYRTAFFHILSDNFRLPTKNNDIVKVHILLLDPVFILPHSICSNTESSDLCTRGNSFDFWVASKISYENCFV